MALRTLPLMLFLISNICPGQTQERLKAVVKTKPGKYETVTVRCELPGDDDDWTYSWFKDGSSQPFSTDREFNFRSDESQKHSSVTCRGQRKSNGQRSEISDAVTLTFSLPETEKPKAVLKVQPDPSLILRGENVTLTCDVQGEGWTYRVMCGNDRYYTSKEKEFKITADITQECVCDGCRGSVCSGWSDGVTLTVSVPETPKPVLTVQPDPSQILRGDTVTLTCDIQGEGWTYKVKCGDDIKHDEDDDEKEFKITPANTQKCQCYGCRGSVCSYWSDEVTLSVSEDRETVGDRPRVTVMPQSSVFTGDTVTLSCDVRHSTGRGIIWYKNFKTINSSDDGTVTLRDVRVSDGGQYGCAVLGETQSPKVMLTVRERPRAVLRVQPDGRVFRGQTVTLTCDIQDTDGTNWTYSWNKDHSQIHDSPSQEYTISSVNESHTGHYRCRGRETGGSRYTHTSDQVTLTLSVPEPSGSPGISGSPGTSRPPGTSGSPITSGPSGSHDLVIGVSAGLSVLFLLIVLLVLLWRCKHKKAGGSPSPSTEHQQRNITTEEQKKNADTVKGPSDVTYAEIDLKPVKGMKKKENQGKTGESSDTVYSKLNIPTA